MSERSLPRLERSEKADAEDQRASLWASAPSSATPSPEELLPAAELPEARPAIIKRTSTRRASLVFQTRGSLDASIASAKAEAKRTNPWASYDSRSWRGPIRALALSVFRYRAGPDVPMTMLKFTAYATVVAAIHQFVDRGGIMDLDPDVVLGLATLMALLMAFRLNISYTRWWEGRLLWGNTSRAIRSICTAVSAGSGEGIQLRTVARDTQTRADDVCEQHVVEVFGWMLAFTRVLRLKLLGEPADGAGSSAERLLGKPRCGKLRDAAHPPLFALLKLRCATTALCEARRAAGHEPLAVHALERHLYQQTEDMHGSLQGCERLLGTPCAPGYVGVLRCSIFAFLALLPFLLLELSFFCVPVVAATGFVLLTAEDLAVQLEVPFGPDANDLPLETYCCNIEADVLTLLEEDCEWGVHDSKPAATNGA